MRGDVDILADSECVWPRSYSESIRDRRTRTRLGRTRILTRPARQLMSLLDQQQRLATTAIQPMWIVADFLNDSLILTERLNERETDRYGMIFTQWQ